ncbi:MAG: hypothetical protein MK096_00665 [Oleiphilaceae bacterium]|nr:hypothetical protein [Oleiphilaceae bacterium]
MDEHYEQDNFVSEKKGEKGFTMRVLLKLAICLVLSGISIAASSKTYIQTGIISEIKIRSNLISNELARNIGTIKLDAGLASQCTDLFFHKDDVSIVGFILAAKAQGQRIEVRYRDDVLSPVNSEHCAIDYVLKKR